MLEPEYAKEAILSWERVKSVAYATAESNDAKEQEEKQKQAEKSLFKASGKELGDAAIFAAKKEAKKQTALAMVAWGKSIKERYQ